MQKIEGRQMAFAGSSKMISELCLDTNEKECNEPVKLEIKRYAISIYK